MGTAQQPIQDEDDKELELHLALQALLKVIQICLIHQWLECSSCMTLHNDLEQLQRCTAVAKVFIKYNTILPLAD